MSASVVPSRARLVLAFAAVYLIWGSTYLGIRYAIETLPPFFMAGVRFLVAGGALFAIACLRGAPLPSFPQWRSTMVVGALLLLGGNGGVTWAEQTVPSGLTALLVALVPAWVVLIDWVRPNGVRPAGPVLAGLALGLVGIGLLINPFGGSQSEINLLGAGVLGFASLSWAIGSVYSQHTAMPQSPMMATALEMLAGGVLLSLAAGLSGEWARVDLAAVSTRSILALAYLIVFGAIVAFTAYMWLLNATTPARAATYAYVNPVVAVFLGWLLAGEPLTVRTLIAAAVIVTAVMLITTYRSREVAVEGEEPGTH